MLGPASPVQLQELAAWTLGNLAADDQATRAALLSHGVIAPLVQVYNALHGDGQQQHSHSELLRVVAWALSNLFKATNLEHSVLSTTPFLSHCYIDWLSDDSQVAVEVSWVLSHLSAHPPAVLRLMVERGLVDVLSRKLERMQTSEGAEHPLQLQRNKSDDVEISTGETTATLSLPSTNVPAATYLPILRIIGNLAALPQSPIATLFSTSTSTATGTAAVDVAPTAVISPLLHFLRASISSSHRGVRRESAWVLSALVRDAPPVIAQSILQANFTPPLHSMLLHSAYDEQVPAATALLRLLPAAPLADLLGPPESARRILAAYLHLLREGDPDCCRMVLAMVAACCDRGRAEGMDCVSWVEEAGGIDALESTMNRDEGGQVWREAQRLIDRYWGEEEEEEYEEDVMGAQQQQQQMQPNDADIPAFRLEAMRRAQQHLQQHNGQQYAQ